MNNESIGVGLIGCGTVGQGVIKLLSGERGRFYAQRLGRSIDLRRVLVRDVSAKRHTTLPPGVLTNDVEAFFADPKIKIVVEVAGGIDPVGGYVRRALESGRHVVTANKSLLAAKGSELFALARKHGVSLAFEASCCGGIPVLAAIKFGLAANRIDAVYGILNGTCNYILTRMVDDGMSYEDALAGAKRMGFAEADPTLDVSGADAAQKLAIIASLAFGMSVRDADVSCRGIQGLEGVDVDFGAELGYALKLIAVARREGESISLRVSPCFVDEQEPIAQVREALNAVSVVGHAAYQNLFVGHGAGQMPTASSVVGDLINVAGGWYPHAFQTMNLWPDQQEPAKLLRPAEIMSRHYIRMVAKDQPGVMAALTSILGQEEISISAILQHEPAGDAPGFVPIVITTHAASGGAIAAAAEQIAGLEAIQDDPVCIPIVDMPRD